ncbi:MAG: SRPBCC family protein [Bauldia sp.]|uniref:SRPBCC family protein n=1 Tax=Bauldia sp. TaxID=2575872 RepID=UPI001D972B0F|nr:SRPBCC family protein [Bauldia sp.]MCB1497421.1 SRPBCC family protein [Bauldia sp.]
MIFKLFGKKGSGGSGVEVGGTKELLHLTQPVDAPVDRAFAVFVDEFDRWWPRDHTWGKDRLKTIGIEPRMGGACYEETQDGERKVWGSVLAFDRPGHIVLAWQIGPDRGPEGSEATASRVDVRFSPAEDGKTNVLVVHRDFFRHGEGWEKYREDMAAGKGWPTIIGHYVRAVEGEG